MKFQQILINFHKSYLNNRNNRRISCDIPSLLSYIYILSIFGRISHPKTIVMVIIIQKYRGEQIYVWICFKVLRSVRTTTLDTHLTFMRCSFILQTLVLSSSSSSIILLRLRCCKMVHSVLSSSSCNESLERPFLNLSEDCKCSMSVTKTHNNNVFNIN